MLSAEELLAGSSLTFEVEVPVEVLRPAGPGGVQALTLPGQAGQAGPRPGRVRLRPLTVHDLQLVTRAAKESQSLVAALMVQRSLVEPEMSAAQAMALPVGLLQFLLDQVNRISGITATAEYVSAAVEAPLVKAAHILAREYGWTPQEVSGLTLGQVLLHLQLLKEQRQA
jgi:hypothetical protein